MSNENTVTNDVRLAIERAVRDFGGPGEPDLSDNDRRVLENVRGVPDRWDGYIPHGAANWTAIRRLERAGLIECVGIGGCETCEGNEPHEGPIFVEVKP